MRKRLTIQFQRAETTIREPITKFGGQPVWISEPAWPISPALSIPMVFVGQILLPIEIVGEPLAGKMGYFFMTDGTDERGRYLSAGLRDDGESAVILQPCATSVPCVTKPLIEGPAIHYYDQDGPRDRRGRLTRKVYPEYQVLMQGGEDPAYVPQGVVWGWDNDDPTQGGWPDAEREAYYEALKGHKIGGTPYFTQNDDYPPGEDWVFLLQLFEQLPDPCLNLGDAGAGYLFLSRDGQRSQFIVQSC